MLLSHDLRKIIHDAAVAWRFMSKVPNATDKNALLAAFKTIKIADLRLDAVRSVTAPDAQKRTLFKEIRDRIKKTGHYITWDVPIMDLLGEPGTKTLEDLAKTVKSRVRKEDP